MAKFGKGNKEGKGRPKGKPNAKTETWNAFSEYCLEGGLTKFKTELNRLEKKDYVQAFLTLLEFHKPKLSRAEHTGEGGEDLIPRKIEIEVVYKK